ncbi:MAG: response regulator [Deltaproteobacteria bacterium]|nr:response regulator [Deltaproteobacteria bacterium]
MNMAGLTVLPIKEPASAECVLGGEALDRLFPFRLLLGNALQVVDVGPSLRRLAPALQAGVDAFEHLKLVYPAIPREVRALRAAVGIRVVLRLRSTGVELRGQLMDSPGHDGVMFVGSPWLGSAEALRASGVSLADYAVHDSTADVIYLLQHGRTAATPPPTPEGGDCTASHDGPSSEPEPGGARPDTAGLLDHVLGATGAVVLTLAPQVPLRASFVSPNLAQVVGVEAAEVVDGFDAYTARVHPDDIPSLNKAVEQCVSRGAACVDHRVRTDERGLRWLRMSLELEREPNGAARHIAAVVQDHTELRGAAEAERRARSDFLAVMSHEIRTPLNAILGMTALTGSALSEDERAGWVHRIGVNAELLRQLIEDMLETTKFDAEEVTLEPRPVALAQLVEDAAAEAAARAELKGLALRASVDPSVPPWVCLDGPRMRQVVVHLLSNAIKFTESGSVDVSLEVAGRDEGSVQLQLSVADTGAGIPIHYHSRLFERFFQVDSTTTRRHGGAGLGLSISQHLVELMGGTIEVDSEPGQGALFTVRLSAAVVDPAPQAEEAPADSTQGAAVALTEPDVAGAEDAAEAVTTAAKPLRILVAEDNPDNMVLARLALTRAGHQVDEATDGLSALSAVWSTEYDVILLDIEMPRVDGLDTANGIREYELAHGRRRVPIVAITAHAVPVFRRRALEAGIDECVAKPISQRDLVAMAESWATRGDPAPAKELAPELLSAGPPADDGFPSIDTLDPDVRDLLPAFIAARRRDVDELAALCEQQRLPEIARIGHNFKGTGTSYGFPAISDAGARLEAAARAEDAAGARTVAGELEMLMQRTEQWVIANHPAAVVSPG